MNVIPMRFGFETDKEITLFLPEEETDKSLMNMHLETEVIDVGHAILCKVMGPLPMTFAVPQKLLSGLLSGKRVKIVLINFKFHYVMDLFTLDVLSAHTE
jgi:hypothetical protein